MEDDYDEYYEEEYTDQDLQYQGPDQVEKDEEEEFFFFGIFSGFFSWLFK